MDDQMLEELPIRALSDQEAQELGLVPAAKPIDPEDEATVKLGRKIWDLAMAGHNRDKIAQRLKMPIKIIEDTLNSYRIRLGVSVDQYRLMDNERIERMINYWLPIALEGPVTVEKIRGQQVFRECDFDRPLEASKFVLQAIDKRCKVLEAAGSIIGGAAQHFGIPGANKPYGERQIFMWLKECGPSIDRLTREAESEVVE